MHSHVVVACLVTAVLVTACASTSRPPSSEVAPPNLSTVGAPAPASPGAEARDDRGTTRPVVPGAWRKPGVSREQKRADMDACHRYAEAQIANDMRIDDDISAARDQINSYQSRFEGLTRRVDAHYYSKQRSARFEDCMQSKGYSLG